tara:strand:- start:129 stop:488 length:360 start_codon:yes stop_codon:yes gene_type:complete
MKKNKFTYSDFSRKEIENLKEYYVTEKVKSMSESELRQFVHENISYQVKNTIGNEEEQEAWDEIEKFFSDKFETILEDIKSKLEATNQNWKIETKKTSSNTKNKENDEIKNEKIDMWND